MNTHESIRQHIRGLREEVDRQHRERHAAIDKLEADLLGSALNASGVAPNATKEKGETSNVARVLSVLDQRRYKTARDVMHETGLSESQVRGALYAKSMDGRIERRKIKGRKADFRLLREGAPNQTDTDARKPSASQAVLGLLADHADGLTAREIGDIVVEQIESNAKNKRSVVFSALFGLKKRRKVDYSEETQRYTKV